MTKPIRAAAWLALALLSGSCAVRESKPVVRTDFDPGTSFAGYRNFAWAKVDPVVVTSPQPLNPNTHAALMQETVSQLRAKGFSHVSSTAEADFAVAFVLGSRDSLQENIYPASVSAVATVGQDYPESVEVREITTGALAIEIFRLPSGSRTWTGWATTGLTMDVYAHSEDTIREMVELILANFPPS